MARLTKKQLEALRLRKREILRQFEAHETALVALMAQVRDFMDTFENYIEPPVKLKHREPIAGFLSVPPVKKRTKKKGR